MELLPGNDKGKHTHTLPKILLLLLAFVAAGTYLPSRYLEVKGGIHMQTD
jgi:hypothetical protein